MGYDNWKTTEPDAGAYDVDCPECKNELTHCTCETGEDEMSAVGLLDIATLLALSVSRDRPLSRIAVDSLDAWREAAGCFMTDDNITQSERVRARILAVEFLSACLREA